nr:hypothetical protein [Asgard group archaeon]
AILNYTELDTLSWLSVNYLGLINVTAIDVQGYYVYLTEWLGGTTQSLHVINNLNPHAPYITYSRNRYAYNYDVQVDGNILYLAGTDQGLGFWIYNITDPYAVEISDYITDNTYGVWGFGQYALMANYQNGVAIVDATNLLSITTASSYTGASRAFQITTDGDFTYVANMTSLVILRHFASMGASFVSGTSTAQSTTISNLGFFDHITGGTLTVSQYAPVGTNVKIFVSADGGVNWQEVTPGVAFSFINMGKDLRWKAEITGPGDKSARIYEISIEYTTEFNPMWYYIFGGAGGGLLLIIIIIIIAASVKKKKKGVPTR